MRSDLKCNKYFIHCTHLFLNNVFEVTSIPSFMILASTNGEKKRFKIRILFQRIDEQNKGIFNFYKGVMKYRPPVNLTSK